MERINTITPMTNEQWKPAMKYPGYEISDQGNARFKGKPVRIRYEPANRKGRPFLQIKCKGGDYELPRLSRVVGELFCADFRPDRRPVYRDGNVKNCAASNLEWKTWAEISFRPVIRSTTKLDWYKALAIRDQRGGPTDKELAKQYGVGIETIRNVWRFITWLPENAPDEFKERASKQMTDYIKRVS